jgi:GT2 family glycosyltransferase
VSCAAIVLQHGGWRRTAGCLAALRRCRPAPDLCVVVDNGSPGDDAARIAAAHPWAVHLALPRNRGFAGGVQAAIIQGGLDRHDFLWLVNNDACPEPEALEAMLAAAGDPEVAAVGGVVRDPRHPARIEAWGGGQVDLRRGVTRHLAAPDRPDYLTGCCLLLRTASLRACGGLDTGFFLYFEDTDLSLRLRAAGWRLAVADRAVVWHRASSTLGLGAPRRAWLFELAARRFFRRWSPAPRRALLRGALHRAAGWLAVRRPRCAVAVLRGWRAARRLDQIGPFQTK